MAFGILRGREESMGLVKTRRLAAMQKQQRAKAGMISASKVGKRNVRPWCAKDDNKSEGRS